MKLVEAILGFEKQRKGSFSKSDRERIVAVAEELRLNDFGLYIVPSKKYPQFIRDVDDVLHVHPTMMVASRPFNGSTDRGVDPYPKYPHHCVLTEWIFDKGKAGRPVCPGCHIEVRLEGTCEFCGWSSSDPD